MSPEELQEFLNQILPETEPGVAPVFCVLRSSPGDNTPWPPVPESTVIARAARPDRAAFYLSTMLSRVNEAGEYRNKQACFAGLHMIVLDDVGDESRVQAVPDLAPTYKVETSSGSFHWVYVLSEIVTDIALARRIIATVYGTEVTDSGGALVNKFCRLPIGINGKGEGEDRNTFEVSLAEFGGGLVTWQDLISSIGVELVEGRAMETSDPRYDYAAVDDPLANWLMSRGNVLDDSGWINFPCPNSVNHRSPGDVAGYSPIGYGGPEHEARGNASCFHTHCTWMTQSKFREWVDEQGGPAYVEPLIPLREGVDDPIGSLVERFALVGGEVADLQSSARTLCPVMPLRHFKDANMQAMNVPTGRGNQTRRVPYWQLWMEHELVTKCRMKLYAPGEDRVLTDADDDSIMYLNSYWPISWVRSTGDIEAYMAHIAHLIPDERERAIFHDWFAFKVQNPALRGFAVVMVADVALGEEGSDYGTGRSLLGDVMSEVLQGGVTKPTLGDISGRGQQAHFNSTWAVGTQLVIVEETSSDSAWKNRHGEFEEYKKIIDPRVIKNVLVRTKYGVDSIGSIMCNFLFLTNHHDAIQLPEKDRRFCVLENTKTPLPPEMYTRIRAFMSDDARLGALYWWYADRDLVGYNPSEAPMTSAKAAMIEASRGFMSVAVEDALELLPGDCCTLPQFRRALSKALDDAGEDGDMGIIRKSAGAIHKQMASIQPGFRLLHKGDKVTPKIIRNHDEVRKSHLKEGNSVINSLLALNDGHLDGRTHDTESLMGLNVSSIRKK